MSSATRVIYLHGFASGPGSTKARFFRDKFTAAGIDITVPDLNVPTFTDMTLSAQLSVVRDEAAKFAEDGSIILMGSSMGGLLATIAAGSMSTQNLAGLILLAPGFGITRRWRELIGEAELEAWRTTGRRAYFNYAQDREVDLAYSFIEDLNAHETEALQVTVPTLIYHGIHDDTVPVEHSRKFAGLNADHVTLVELNDGHELTRDLESLWQGIQGHYIW